MHELQDEIARVAPAFTGVDDALLERARDGVMLPLAEHHADLVLDAEALPITDASWEPIQPGTIASEEGVSSHMGTGVVESSGTGSSTTVKPGAGCRPGRGRGAGGGRARRPGRAPGGPRVGRTGGAGDHRAP